MKKNFFEAGAERHSSNTLGPLHHKYTVGTSSISDYQLPMSVTLSVVIVCQTVIKLIKVIIENFFT